MNDVSINSLKSRIRRILDRLGDKHGSGGSWECKTPNDNSLTFYYIKNIKPPEDWEDEFANLANWVWSLKDYIKKSLVSHDPSIECFVNKSRSLCLTADIANGFKHGGLDRPSRSGHRLIIGKVRYEIPQEGVKSFHIGERAVVVDAKPEAVTVKIPITTEAGVDLGDGFEILNDAMSEWETFLANSRSNSRLNP